MNTLLTLSISLFLCFCTWFEQFLQSETILYLLEDRPLRRTFLNKMIIDSPKKAHKRMTQPKLFVNSITQHLAKNIQNRKCGWFFFAVNYHLKIVTVAHYVSRLIIIMDDKRYQSIRCNEFLLNISVTVGFGTKIVIIKFIDEEVSYKKKSPYLIVLWFMKIV